MGYETFEKLCKERGVKPSEVSRKTGVATSTLTCWKKGEYTPKQEKLQKIADYFNVSLNYLSSGNNKEFSITESEYKLICAYRALPEAKKEVILDILHIESAENREKDALGA